MQGSTVQKYMLAEIKLLQRSKTTAWAFFFTMSVWFSSWPLPLQFVLKMMTHIFSSIVVVWATLQIFHLTYDHNVQWSSWCKGKTSQHFRSNAMLCHHKKRFAYESSSDHNISTFCTSCPCILFICKNQRQVKANLVTLVIFANQLSNNGLPYHECRKGDAVSPCFLWCERPCRKLFHFTTMTLTRSQPWGGFRRAEHISWAGQRTLSRLWQKRKEEVMCKWGIS